MILYENILDLQAFAEEGTGETGSAAESVSGEYAEVQYGIQPNQPAAEVETEKPERASFDDLIKGDYKADFDAKVQGILKARLKNADKNAKALKDLEPMFDLLSSKYGVDAKDFNALSAAIQEDSSFYEDEAYRLGVSVDQLKATRKLERQNAELNARLEEVNLEQQKAQILAKWNADAEKMKTIYPDFDLQAELGNESFVQLITSQNPVDMKTAYEVVHHDEIFGNAMRFTAQKVEQKIANKIISQGTRPSENGNHSQSAPIVKNDVNSLTNKDLDEIEKQIRSGKRISFGRTPMR